MSGRRRCHEARSIRVARYLAGGTASWRAERSGRVVPRASAQHVPRAGHSSRFGPRAAERARPNRDRARLGARRCGVSPAVHGQIFPTRPPDQAALVPRARGACRPRTPHARRELRRRIDASAYLHADRVPDARLHTRGDVCAPFDEGLYVASSFQARGPAQRASHVRRPPVFVRSRDRRDRSADRLDTPRRASVPDYRRTRRARILEHIARGSTTRGSRRNSHCPRAGPAITSRRLRQIGAETHTQAIVQARGAGLAGH